VIALSSPTRIVPAAPTVRRSRWWRPTTPLARGQLLLLALLAALTLGAWALTVHQARTMDMPMGVVARGGAEPADPAPASDGMAGMDGMETEEPVADGMGGAASSGMAGMAEAAWTWDGFATFLVAWAVMMAAMMFPAAAPMLLLFRTVAASRRARGGAFVPTWVFAAGYLLVWTAVGAATWVLVRVGSELAGRLGEADRATWAPLALGAVLVVAGLYQLTPLKRVCLDHCRTPLGFVTRHWRDGRRGALRMGVVHGAYCLGCCWALFAVLVAAGVMSLAWMLLLTLVVFAEKVLPIGRWGPRAVGAAFLLLGGLVAAGAADLPWTA
jgi:predicted metal-binding membrane protein